MVRKRVVRSWLLLGLCLALTMATAGAAVCWSTPWPLLLTGTFMGLAAVAGGADRLG